MIFERLFRPKTTRIELDLTDAQIVQLRGVMDHLPTYPYVGLVVAVVKKLPLESADCPPSVADARPAQNISERGRGFSLDIKLGVRKHLTTDLRAPIDAHKLARVRECKKVEPAIEYPDWRLEELGRKYAPADAYEPNEVNE